MLDLAAVYQGDLVQGYWKNPGKVTWKAAEIAELDTRVVLGSGSQVWFGATWIYAPVETPLEFEFQGHRMTPLRWFLNGQKLDVPEKAYVDSKNLHRMTVSRPVTLKAGWNQVFFRGYNVGYAPFKVGVVLKAPDEKLWPLRFSDVKPR
jgi:hypothetical protein